MAKAHPNTQVIPRFQVYLRIRPLVGWEAKKVDAKTRFKFGKRRRGKVEIEIENKSECEKNGSSRVSKALTPRSKLLERMAKRRKKTEHAFCGVGFNGVFGEESTNHKVYLECVDALVDHALVGQTSMIFAYGNTGSGKTHTILGSKGERGLYHMAAHKMCIAVSKANEADPGLKASISLKFAELHLDKAYDLLDDRTECFIRENEGSFVFRRQGDENTDATGLETKFCTSIEEIANAVKSGVQNRVSGTSTFHTESSRSHARLALEITCNELEDIREQIVKYFWFWVLANNRQTKELPNIIKLRIGKPAKLNPKCELYDTLPFLTEDNAKTEFTGYDEGYRWLFEQWKNWLEKRVKELPHMGGKVVLVDLAGSEHGTNDERDLKQTAQEKREGKKINLSLMALNEVFRQRAADGRPKYRESTLTKTLRDYLENDSCKCLMISTLSSSRENLKPSISTLNYASQLAKLS